MTTPDPIRFEGPIEHTLFILEAGELRILTLEGREVLLLVGDFVALLLHVSLHRVAALARLPPQVLRLVAAALEEDLLHGEP